MILQQNPIKNLLISLDLNMKSFIKKNLNNLTLLLVLERKNNLSLKLFHSKLLLKSTLSPNNLRILALFNMTIINLPPVN